eukprot:CAMPEP_0184480888 /NCGR_PEP_ID=MMETSP0113_2-20130426/2380_1 /TAXON_ID=91329 /ORGANISM="Norrisiella sphaerica, Strain BC52" /LENGTH=503 /DNA_ID=CAMNT_0026859671 /DNA_START=190 /DNA_END=1701 /DNA_ORIENTATION=-
MQSIYSGKRKLEASNVKLEKRIKKRRISSRSATRALWRAVKSDDLEIVRSLLSDPRLKIHVNEKDKMGGSMLMSTASPSVARLLVQHKANVEMRDRFGHTALIEAVIEGRYDMVRFLIAEAGANVEARDDWANTCFMLAASRGLIPMARFLVKFAKPNVLAADVDGHNALHHAAKYNDCVAARFLVSEVKASVDCTAHNGATPLICASQCGNIAMVRYFVEARANVEAISLNRTALMWAAAKGRHNVASYLVYSANAKVNQNSEFGTSALALAAYTPHTSIVRMLVDMGANIEAGDSGGRTPLMIASRQGRLNTVKFLVQSKANVYSECAGSDGRTAVAKAMFHGHRDVVNYLIDEAKVDPKEALRIIERAIENFYAPERTLRSSRSGDAFQSYSLKFRVGRFGVLDAALSLLSSPEAIRESCIDTQRICKLIQPPAAARKIATQRESIIYAVLHSLMPKGVLKLFCAYDNLYYANVQLIDTLNSVQRRQSDENTSSCSTNIC